MAQAIPQAFIHDVPPAHQATDAVAVVAYDGLTATHATHGDHTAPAAHPQFHPAEPHKQTQHDPVASAVAPTHHAHPLHAVPLFPFLIILAVPVSVSVQETYIAYQAGSRVCHVLTVRSV